MARGASAGISTRSLEEITVSKATLREEVRSKKAPRSLIRSIVSDGSEDPRPGLSQNFREAQGRLHGARQGR